MTQPVVANKSLGPSSNCIQELLEGWVRRIDSDGYKFCIFQQDRSTPHIIKRVIYHCDLGARPQGIKNALHFYPNYAVHIDEFD